MGDYAEQMVNNTAIVQAVAPIDIEAAGATGTSISLKHWDHCTIIIQTGAWTAGNAACDLDQDTSVTPTGAVKTLAFTSYWTNDGAVGSNTLTKTACASTFNADVAAATYVIEIDADDLDADNNFDCLHLDIGDPASGGANLISAEYILTKGRYVGPSSTIKDVTID